MDENELISIVPNGEHLSVEELKKQRNHKFKPVKVGSKRTIAHGSHEEALELNDYFKNLEQQLSVKRINTPDKLMEAVWEEDSEMAKVTRRAGKLEKFGVTLNKQLYLDYFEALFLLESGRLMLINENGDLLSIEEAYLSVLGKQQSNKFNNYLVYSHLTKCGYILRRHKHYSSLESTEELGPTATDYIWSLLLHNVMGKAIPEKLKYSNKLDYLRRSMEDIKDKTIKSIPIDTSLDEPPTNMMIFNKKITPVRMGKMENGLKHAAKRFKYNNRRSLLNCFTDEPDFLRFQEFFQSFNVIELNSYLKTTQYFTDYEITYDLYLPNNGFKKSAFQLPTYHVLVLETGMPFPCHKDIFHLSKKENHVPVLVVSVSDSKQIHAFLYHFSS